MSHGDDAGENRFVKKSHDTGLRLLELVFVSLFKSHFFLVIIKHNNVRLNIKRA